MWPQMPSTLLNRDNLSLCRALPELKSSKLNYARGGGVPVVEACLVLELKFDSIWRKYFLKTSLKSPAPLPTCVRDLLSLCRHGGPLLGISSALFILENPML